MRTTRVRCAALEPAAQQHDSVVLMHGRCLAPRLAQCTGTSLRVADRSGAPCLLTFPRRPTTGCAAHPAVAGEGAKARMYPDDSAPASAAKVGLLLQCSPSVSPTRWAHVGPPACRQLGVHDSVSQSELWLPSRVNRPPAPSPATTSPATGHSRRPARPQDQPGEDVAARQGHHVGRVGVCLQNLQSDWWLIQMAQGHHVSPAGSALA